MAKKKEIGFDDKLKQLRLFVDQLQQGDLSLEESMDLFNKSKGLINECRTYLKEAELIVHSINKDGSEQEFDI